MEAISIVAIFAFIGILAQLIIEIRKGKK